MVIAYKLAPSNRDRVNSSQSFALTPEFTQHQELTIQTEKSVGQVERPTLLICHYRSVRTRLRDDASCTSPPPIALGHCVFWNRHSPVTLAVITHPNS